jgi:ferrochelatase
MTQRLAAQLENLLNLNEPNVFRVTAGMRFSAPSIGGAVLGLAEDRIERVLGLILSPQYSPALMSGYSCAVEQAAVLLGLPSRTVGAWHLNWSFIRVMADRLRRALQLYYPDDLRHKVPVLLTAHSLPQRVVDREPEYVAQLEITAREIAAAAGLQSNRWTFCYQSAGHTPEEWLKPDMLDVLPRLAAQGHRHVVVAPVQFVADHLETLYDVDVAGREQAKQSGFATFNRVPAPNDAEDFAAALANVVRDALCDWNRQAVA